MSTSMDFRLWVRAPRMVIWVVASTLEVNVPAEAGAGSSSGKACVRATVHYPGEWGCVARGIVSGVVDWTPPPYFSTKVSPNKDLGLHFATFVVGVLAICSSGRKGSLHIMLVLAGRRSVS